MLLEASMTLNILEYGSFATHSCRTFPWSQIQDIYEIIWEVEIHQQTLKKCNVEGG